MNCYSRGGAYQKGTLLYILVKGKQGLVTKAGEANSMSIHYDHVTCFPLNEDNYHGLFSLATRRPRQLSVRRLST